jgi:hypothetical protein
MKDLSIITVTFQSQEYIDDLILSVITGIKGHTYEHFIVDNASTDGTPEFIEEKYAEQVTLIRLEKNFGFSYANNLALKRATGKMVLFLNPDMRLKEGLDNLIDWFEENPQVGIAGCKLLDREKEMLKISFPKPFPSLSKEILWLLRLNGFFSNTEDFEGEKEQFVDSIKGAFMLVKKELIQQLGWGFDPRYFLLFEDFDLCREAKRLGFQVAYTPQASCLDYNSRSFAKMPNEWIYRQCTRSLLIYFRKWHPWYEWIWIVLFIPIGYFLRIPVWGIKTSLKNILKKFSFS